MKDFNFFRRILIMKVYTISGKNMEVLNQLKIDKSSKFDNYQYLVLGGKRQKKERTLVKITVGQNDLSMVENGFIKSSTEINWGKKHLPFIVRPKEERNGCIFFLDYINGKRTDNNIKIKILSSNSKFIKLLGVNVCDDEQFGEALPHIQAFGRIMKGDILAFQRGNGVDIKTIVIEFSKEIVLNTIPGIIQDSTFYTVFENNVGEPRFIQKRSL